MRSTQRGVTFIGWLFLLIPVAILVYAGIRLTPVYLNYFRVARSLEQTAQQYQDGGQINPQDVRFSIEKRFDVESVDFPTAKDIDIHRQGEGWVMIADYEGYAPLFGNIALVIDFHKEVGLP
ncbi:MAG: DUF4845 domain-containing protein [Gammaproteobacteria bacterium]|nr:DUF4845 domain-containing protein [Gammaproteobacteria bacterium]